MNDFLMLSRYFWLFAISYFIHSSIIFASQNRSLFPGKQIVQEKKPHQIRNNFRSKRFLKLLSQLENEKELSEKKIVYSKILYHMYQFNNAAYLSDWVNAFFRILNNNDIKKYAHTLEKAALKLFELREIEKSLKLSLATLKKSCDLKFPKYKLFNMAIEHSVVLGDDRKTLELFEYSRNCLIDKKNIKSGAEAALDILIDKKSSKLLEKIITHNFYSWEDKTFFIPALVYLHFYYKERNSKYKLKKVAYYLTNIRNEEGNLGRRVSQKYLERMAQIEISKIAKRINIISHEVSNSVISYDFLEYLLSEYQEINEKADFIFTNKKSINDIILYRLFKGLNRKILGKISYKVIDKNINDDSLRKFKEKIFTFKSSILQRMKKLDRKYKKTSQKIISYELGDRSFLKNSEMIQNVFLLYKPKIIL